MTDEHIYIYNVRMSSATILNDALVSFRCRQDKYFSYVFHTSHYENTPFKDIENFTAKEENFSDKDSDIFHISDQNTDCGYLLEPPRRGGSNEYPQSMVFNKIRKIMYTPVISSFTI